MTPMDAAAVLIRMSIPMEILGRYEEEAERLDKPIDAVLVEQLRKYQQIPVDDRPLVLTAAEREIAEQLLAGPIKDAQALLTKLRGAVELSVNGVKLTLAPWQLAELKRRAEKNGTSQKQELEKAVREIESLLFHGGA